MHSHASQRCRARRLVWQRVTGSGLLALQADAYRDVEAYPLDILRTETNGMIGYMLEQKLGNRAPVSRLCIAFFLTMVGRWMPRSRRSQTNPSFIHPVDGELRQVRSAAEKGSGTSSRTAPS